MVEQSIYLDDTIVSNFFYSEKGQLVPKRLSLKFLSKHPEIYKNIFNKEEIINLINQFIGKTALHIVEIDNQNF